MRYIIQKCILYLLILKIVKYLIFIEYYATDNINLKRSDKYVALSNLSIYYTWKNIKSNIKTINLKFQLQHEMKNLNYLMDKILYQIFKIIFNIY